MFPKIKIAFLEAGCGWVPFLMERMDYKMERLEPTFKTKPLSAPAIKKLPSEYIRAGNIYVSCEAPCGRTDAADYREIHYPNAECPVRTGKCSVPT